MNVLEIAANMVRNAVDTMSSKFSAFVKNEINEKVSTLYKPGGAATLATLPALTADNAGYVYDMSEVFTTTASFREGAGHKYPAGTNVVISDAGGNVYKYDVLSGMLDGYVQESRKVGNVPLSADIPVTLTGDTAITVTNTGTASAIGYSVAHNDSDVSAGSKGDTTNQTPGFGGTFKALSVTVDAKGHVTALSDHTTKIPDAEATQSAKGLMSATDKKKLDTLIDSTLSNTGKAADAKATGDAIAYLRDYFKSMDVSRTASGNPATFSDAKAANVEELSVTITPTQSGSGDPSPTNIRPISGVSSVTVTRTGANGANPQSVTVTLTDGANPLTVYGGTLNVTTGELTVTWAAINIQSATPRTYNGLNYFGVSIPAAGFQGPVNSMCSALRYSGGLSATNGYYLNSDTGPLIIHFADQSINTTKKFNEYAEAIGLQFVYKLATPVTYQLTPAQLSTLSGYNAVSSDAGSVDMTYKADTSLVWGGG